MDSIFDILETSIEELAETDRDIFAFAAIIGEEVRASYLSGGKILPLDYYRYFGRSFCADEWKEAATP